MTALALIPSEPPGWDGAALVTRDDWTRRVRKIVRPVRVIHAAQDPILPVADGRAIADGIPQASLAILARGGHDIPVTAIPAIGAHIAAHVQGV